MRVQLINRISRAAARCAAVAAVFLIAACTAPVKLGDSETESRLKGLVPVDDKISVYVCREPGRSGRGMRSTVIVDGKVIGMLLPNMFAHTVVIPGSHSVHLRNEAPGIPSNTTGELAFSGKAGEVVVLWVGVTGGGWGTLTIDNFDSQVEGRRCVANASFAIVAD